MTSPGDYYAFVVSRLFGGICASVPLILGSEVVLRIFPIHQRGRCFHILHVPYLFGVVAGPTIGGYIVSRTAWPVQFWWTVGMNGLLILLILLFLENTEYDGTHRSEASQRPLSKETFLKRRAKTYLLGAAAPKSISLKDCVRNPPYISFPQG